MPLRQLQSIPVLNSWWKVRSNILPCKISNQSGRKNLQMWRLLLYQRSSDWMPTSKLWSKVQSQHRWKLLWLENLPWRLRAYRHRRLRKVCKRLRIDRKLWRRIYWIIQLKLLLPAEFWATVPKRPRYDTVWIRDKHPSGWVQVYLHWRGQG